MTTLLIKAAPFLISFILAVCLVPLVRELSWRIGLVDHAARRGYKTHVGSVPYGGGGVIFVATALPLMAMLAFVLHGAAPPTEDFAEWVWPGSISPVTPGTIVQIGQILSLFGCGAILFLLGLVDDWKELNQLLRFGLQIGTATLLVSAVPGFRLPLGSTPIVESAATIIWIAAMTNAFNFLDNMDGLTAGISSLSFVGATSMALAVGNGPAFLLGGLVAGAAAGFLLFNFPKASIFMGDAGGLFLGFVAAGMTVLLSDDLASSATPSLCFVPLLLLTIPTYDVLSVIAIRLALGLKPWMGDTNHISHRLVSLGLSRRTAVLCIHGLTALTTVIAICHIFTAGGSAGLTLAVGLILSAMAALDLICFYRRAARANG